MSERVMHDSVRDAFYGVNAPWEGVTTWLYLDVLGLVTVGVGNLVDPVEYALGLPFVHADGRRATREEIRSAWLAVKARKDMAARGGGAFRSLTTIRLTDDGVCQLVAKKLRQNAAHMRLRFVGWDSWPADAQLAVLCLAWAVGPSFRWPMLEAALRSGNFALAALECRISDKGNPGVKPRNEGMQAMLRNAAWVASCGAERSTLYYPREAAHETPTLPDLPGPRESSPVLETDGGASRRAMLSEAIRGVGPDAPDEA